ncbi:PREDICTED: zinc transporter 4 [Charadrius vociferus]|uniref:zinc transporter 4 n=1 Tax=Charadrius vociferus TaxID=50402 RepID=UPI000521B535|nr:PREDICTED: zinc transporter 4 [Charadrius vociferus]
MAELEHGWERFPGQQGWLDRFPVSTLILIPTLFSALSVVTWTPVQGSGSSSGPKTIVLVTVLGELRARAWNYAVVTYSVHENSHLSIDRPYSDFMAFTVKSLYLAVTFIHPTQAHKRLTLAALLYLLFMTGELIGGYVANSLAIMTDALHMLTDLSGIILTLLALWLSAKSPTKRFTFGFHRLEVLSAIISVLLVYILMAFLLYEAVQRTIHMDYEINGDIMLITAAVGVAVNLIMGFLLNQSGHLHSHSHSHPHSHVPQSNSPNAAHSSSHGHSSLAVRAAFVHALGDLVQSIGVLVAAYIIRFKPEYKIADPICTYVFSILVVLTTVRILCDTGVIILEGVPRHLNVDRIKEDLMKIEDVYSIEDLNVWSLTAGKTTAIVHLQLVPGSSSKWEEVQSKARHLLLNTFGMYKCSVQLQSYRQEISKTCTSCQSSSA